MRDYSAYLETYSAEWQKLDEICQVTISRFYRDKMVFAYLAETVLPALCQHALQQGRRELRVWSVGCASGEEPYSMALLWAFCLKQRYSQLIPYILATDTKYELLNRAQRACYPFSSVRNLPTQWRDDAFSKTNGDYCLQPVYKQRITFQYHDIRQSVPDSGFDLILCRNLAFTYYDQTLQTRVAEQLINALQPAGALVLGVHEALPAECPGVETWSKRFSIYRKHQ
ncbi:MAG: chemotaxis protein CheR [Halobacteria archaeon]|nr:chemotaxis protein CheR [Halobacteria archaeon]